MKTLYTLVFLLILSLTPLSYAKVGDTYNCSVDNHIRHYYSSYTKQGIGPED